MYVRYSNPNNPLVGQLKSQLKNNNVTLAASPADAKTILNIISIQSQTALTSMLGNVQSGQYTLYQTVSFELVNKENKVLIPMATVKKSTQYTSNATQILSTSSTEQQLSSTLIQSSLVNLIVFV